MKLAIAPHERGYTMSLSGQETRAWAHRPGAVWPVSMLAGKDVRVTVDANGLVDYTVNGRQPDIFGGELEAIIDDHLPKEVRHLWPAWGRTPFVLQRDERVVSPA